MNDNGRKIESLLLLLARVVSALFNPLWFVIVLFVLMFTMTYLAVLPLFYKMYVLAVVLFFTVLLPLTAIFAYGRLLRLPKGYLSVKENRLIPYAFTLLSYFFGYLLMQRMLVPYYMTLVLLVALVAMLVCALVNVKWKISEHLAAAGAATGGVIFYGPLFTTHVVWWLCAMIFVSGLLATARMALGEHSLRQVFWGWTNGFVSCVVVLCCF